MKSSSNTKLAEDVIREVNLKPRYFGLAYKAIIICFLVSIFIVFALFYLGIIKSISGVVVYIPTAALIFTGIQWQAARGEISLDKYYERLNNTNKYLLDWSQYKWRDNSQEKEAGLYNGVLFSEMDNLEYILEKYKLGYVGRPLVVRALRHFISCCKSREGFLEAVQAGVGDSSEPGWLEGYHTTTYAVIWSILSKLDKPNLLQRSGHRSIK